MELRTFVAETLKQIIDGVVDAQAHGKDKGAVINPAKQMMSLRNGIQETDDPARSQDVEFDVAVTACEGTEKKGGLGIVVCALVLGGQGQATASTQSVSRVKFTVPIFLPPQKRPKTPSRPS